MKIFDLLLNDWRLRYVPLAFRLAVMKEYQEIGVWNWRDLSSYEQDLFHLGYENTQRLVKAFVEAGGKLYAGTDSAHLSTPGLSLAPGAGADGGCRRQPASGTAGRHH